MRKIASLAAALGGMLVLFLHAAPVQAASRTWVSGTGTDAGTCTRTAPCASYAFAFGVTDTGGEINCVDPVGGGFGTLVINKSISIVCDYTEGGVLVEGFYIDAPAGSIITLKGQDVECRGAGLNGIAIVGVGVTVHIHKVQIRNCRGGSASSGILVGNSSGVATVFVDSSYITDNGSNTSEAGILIRPNSGASANVSVTRTHLERNTNGIFANGSGDAGPSNVSVKDSVLSGSSNVGIAVASPGAAFNAMVDNTLINFNINTGAAVAGASATLRIGNSTITQNVTGVANFGGTLQSFKNNVIAGNGTDGTPMTAFPGPGGQPLQ